MRAIDELGMRDADWGALMRDAPERPPDRRRRPDPTPASEDRERLERRDRAKRRAHRLANLAEGETLDEVAEALGVSPDVAEEAYDHVVNGRTLRPEAEAALGRRSRRTWPRSELREALGDEDFRREIAEEARAEALGRVSPADRGSDVEPLTRTAAETREYLGELAENRWERPA
jgi:hypothetical protein